MRKLIVAIVCLAVMSVADARSSRRNKPQFIEGRPALMLEQVKALAGTWETRAPDGSVHLTQYSVTAGGSAVREVMFPGTERERTNMYHMDGDVLVVTHYGPTSQPRMRAAPDLRGQIEFEFESASNITPGTSYIGQLKLRMRDADTLIQEWTSYGGHDQPPRITAMEFRRVSSEATTAADLGTPAAVNIPASAPASLMPMPALR